MKVTRGQRKKSNSTEVIDRGILDEEGISLRGKRRPGLGGKPKVPGTRGYKDAEKDFMGVFIGKQKEGGFLRRPR